MAVHRGARWLPRTLVAWSTSRVLVTIYGVVALTFMMAMYALESRHRFFVAAFAIGCALSSGYGFISGAWPFGVVELIWSVVALRRYRGLDTSRRRRRHHTGPHSSTDGIQVLPAHGAPKGPR